MKYDDIRARIILSIVAMLALCGAVALIDCTMDCSIEKNILHDISIIHNVILPHDEIIEVSGWSIIVNGTTYYRSDIYLVIDNISIKYRDNVRTIANIGISRRGVERIICIRTIQRITGASPGLTYRQMMDDIDAGDKYMLRQARKHDLHDCR